MGPWANSSLSLYGELTSTLRLRCEAQNTHGKETVTVLLLPGQGVMGDAQGDGAQAWTLEDTEWEGKWPDSGQRGTRGQASETCGWGGGWGTWRLSHMTGWGTKESWVGVGTLVSMDWRRQGAQTPA